MKSFITLFSAVALLLAAAACRPSEKSIAVSSVTVAPATLNLTVGESSQLTATVEPSDATDSAVLWSSSNSDVAMVGSDGKVAALKEGKATVTATAGGKSASCEVTVNAQQTPVKSVQLDKSSLELIEGDTHTINAMVEPDDATDKTVTWSSSDGAVVTVKDGVITAVSVGSATITATAGGVSAECRVEVYPIYEYVDLGLSVNWGAYNIGASAPEEFGNYYAWGEIEPKEEYSWSTYKWCDGGSQYNMTKYVTNNQYGAHVDGKSVLETEDDVATGSRGPRWRIPTAEEWQELINQCNWQATTQNGVDGYRAMSKVNDNSIFIPNAGRFEGTVLNNACTYWSSSISGDTPSNAFYVYWYSWSGRFSYSIAPRFFGVPIRPVMDHGYVPVESITLNKEKVRLVIGRTASLKATVNPAWATNGNVVWTSSNPQVATVENGLVTAISEGTITVTASADGVDAVCTVVVEAQREAEAVDLGLSVKWASFNVGANAPEDLGDHFAWGETEYKEDYSWATYKWCEGASMYSLTKYNTTTNYGRNPDNKTILEPDDDAAHVHWGSDWRIPTDAEWEELLTNCKWQTVSQNGVDGCRVSSKTNNNSIFIPFAGYYEGSTYLKDAPNYRSSTVYSDSPYRCWHYYYSSYYGRFSRGNADRCQGMSVRPVQEK